MVSHPTYTKTKYVKMDRIPISDINKCFLSTWVIEPSSSPIPPHFRLLEPGQWLKLFQKHISKKRNASCRSVTWVHQITYLGCYLDSNVSYSCLLTHEKQCYKHILRHPIKWWGFISNLKNTVWLLIHLWICLCHFVYRC